eukprot:360299-Karenia_brevis.AAC.1
MEAEIRDAAATAEEAGRIARETIAQMYPRANLDELLPPLEPADEAFPERVAPTNVHPVTQHDLGFGQGTPNTE